MPAEPEIAVIVGAYSRETYLLDAVRSVLEQTLPRDRFELVVLRNFHRDDIDRALEAQGVPSLFYDEARIGRWLLHAVRATRAPLITILDDDDLFAPDRLAHIVDVFREHPTTGLYRNRVELIDTYGTVFPRYQWRPKGIDLYFDTSGPVVIPTDRKTDLVDLLFRRTRAGFNLSTMAFRRELLDGRRGEHFETTQLPDLAMLVTGVVAPYGIYLDDRRLTRHRFHADSTTRQVAWLRAGAVSNRRLAEEAREFGRDDFATYLAEESDHYERLFLGSSLVERVGEGAGRREVAGRVAAYLRFLARHPGERDLSLAVWAAVGYGIAYLLAPGVTRRVERSRATQRRKAGVPTIAGRAGATGR